ncbi:MAG: hypothetical protein FGM54_10425, partial [Chitinophagaceae bacterium]|nr:hypothetical protein [Chitinophagaceae bacterium]
MGRPLGILDLLFLFCFGAHGQFAPQAGQIGSTAIYKDSSIMLAWGDSCRVERGWMNIADTLLGKVSS